MGKVTLTLFHPVVDGDPHTYHENPTRIRSLAYNTLEFVHDGKRVTTNLGYIITEELSSEPPK